MSGTSDPIGQRVGRLVIARIDEQSGVVPSMRKALCLCDCGSEKLVRLDDLKKRYPTRSCGCIQRETAAMQGRASATHGLSGHPHFSRWRGMMGRCYEPNHKAYQNYGGRGVRVCQEWRDPAAFVAYLEETLGPCPEGHTLDRIDNDGPYEPGNVRWVDWTTQHRNKRRT